MNDIMKFFVFPQDDDWNTMPLNIKKKPITRRKTQQVDVVAPKSLNYNVGMFLSAVPFTGVEEEILLFMNKFYTSAMIEDKLIPLITQKHVVSLRSLDWLVTNYAKKLFITCFKDPNEQNQRATTQITVIYNEYEIWLKRYHRIYFDPFKRLEKKNPVTGVITKKDPVYFYYKNNFYVTTVAQLMFIYWAILRGILEFAETHIDDINIDMKECAEKAKAEKERLKMCGMKRKRKELNKTSRCRCVIFERSVVTKFNND